MTLSVFYQHLVEAARERNLPIQEVCRLAKEMGYTMVELDFDALASDASIPEILREAGLSVSSIYCFFKFDEAHDEERIASLIQWAQRIGAGRVMPIPGFFHAEDEEGREEEMERMLSSMEALAAEADKAGITVTIEDFDSAISPIRCSALMLRFLNRIPSLRATFDTGNFRFSAEPEEEAFAALKDRIAHVHLKDRTVAPDYGDHPLIAMDGAPLYPCPVGSGMIPMDWILAQLKAMGYEGALVTEHFGCRDTIAAMKKSAEYIRERWNA